MNNLKIPEAPEPRTIRTIKEDGKVLFCAKDFVKALGYSDVVHALRSWCRRWVKRPIADEVGRVQQTNFITDGEVYRLVVHSKLPAAEKFERWIFDKMIPAVQTYRRDGTVSDLGAALKDPDFDVLATLNHEDG